MVLIEVPEGKADVCSWCHWRLGNSFSVNRVPSGGGGGEKQ